MTRMTPSATVIAFPQRRPAARAMPDGLRYPATLEVLASRAAMLLETLKVVSS
jgi:hypothetical protein